MRRNPVAAIGAVLLTGACLPHPPPAPPPPEVTPNTADVATTVLSDATLARYTGTYRNGGDALVIARVGAVLTATRGGGGSRSLRLIGLGTFIDAVGTSYLFTPPGGGGTLTTIALDDQRRTWSR